MVSGLEMELAAKLSADDKLRFSGAFTKSKLGELVGFSNDYALPACTDPRAYNKPGDPTSGFVSANCLDVTGHEMPHAPRFSGTVLYEHSFHLGGSTLTPRTSIHYETASYLSVFNLGDGDRQKSYARIDLGARYDTGKWWADFFVRNVTDGKIKTSAGGGNGGIFTAQYKPPRTVGVNAGIDF
jgi:iron complex outermembrane receptor protein